MPIHFRNTPVSEPFTFDTAGNHWNQESVTRPKGFSLYHYLQTEKGSGKIEIQEKKYVLREGEGVLIAPFIRHSYVRESREWLTLFATFTGTMESSIPRLVGNRPLIFTEKDQAARIGALISEVLEKYKNPPADAKTLSVDCYRLLLNFVDSPCINDLTSDPLYQRYVAPVIKKIETHFDTDLTVCALSRQVYVTPQYLSRLFGRFLGCSAYEYLTVYRINKAKEYLLTNQRLEIQEIARRTGYPDASHFISIFKKVTGQTPGEFRKMNNPF